MWFRTGRKIMAAAQQRSTVVGVFEDRLHADQAIAELKQAGFRDDQIGVAMRHSEEFGSATSDADDGNAGSGAMTGALAGLGLGTLAGLGVLAGVIPVIGPAIAAGTLGVILSNAAAGAGIAGLVGALIGAGIPEHEATYYQGEFEAGRAIVTVQADGRADEASAILRRHRAYDMSTRGSVVGASTAGTASTTRATGSSAHVASSSTHATASPTHVAGTSTHGASAHASTRTGDTIELKEEQLHVDKRPVETGEVRVRKEVHTETKSIDVPVQREEIVIERTPAHGKATSDTIRAGEEVRIPVREDQVNVSKNAVVTEEVKVGKKVVQDVEHVSGNVRKEEIRVEKTGDVDVRSAGTDKHGR